MLVGLADIAPRGGDSVAIKYDVFKWLVKGQSMSSHINPIRRLWGRGWRENRKHFARIMELIRDGVSLEEIRATVAHL